VPILEITKSLKTHTGQHKRSSLNVLFKIVNNTRMEYQKIQALWGHLHWLSVLAQQGSYTATAARLGVSKAAVSQRVAELERAARVPLVQRTTRSVRLTEAGQRLVDETMASFEHIAQSFEQVRDLADQPRGLLRVTAPVALARQQLMPLITQFLQAYPEVRIELDMADRLRSLATEGFDLAVRHTDRAPDTHVAWTLCSTSSVLVATKAYLRRHGTPETPHDLAQHNCLHYPRAQDTPVWSFTPAPHTPSPSANKTSHAKRGMTAAPPLTVAVRGSLSANNSEALREAALASAGIALLPDFSAQAALRKGQLIPVLPNWQVDGGFGQKIFAIRPYSPHVPRAVSALVAHLRNGLATGFGTGVEGMSR
jgi:DNA-binding transcriptional LysR family regulator